MKVGIVTNNRNSMIFSDSLNEAAKQLGHSAYIFELDYSKSVQAERQRLLELVAFEEIEIVLFLNDFRFKGNSFFISKKIAERVDCRLWIWDTMYDINTLRSHINLYSRIYSFEIQDVIQLEQQYSIAAKYMPLFAGPEFYANPRSDNDLQDIDIFFIGTIAGSEKRLTILEAVAKLAYEKGYKMLVFGRAWHDHHWYQRVIGKFKFSMKYPYLAKCIENRVLLPKDVISYYKRAKINLNIHVEGQTCYNCRTFEVMGNHNFLLSDAQDICDLKMQAGVHFDVYHDEIEIAQKVQYYMEHYEERNKIAHEGGNLISSEYNLVYSLACILAKE